MLLHHIGEHVPVLGEGKAFDGFHTGEGLEAEFRHIPEVIIPVIREGLHAVPHIPVVDITPGFVVGIVKAAAAGGAGRPVEGLGVLPLHHLGQNILIHFDVVGLLPGFGHPQISVHKHLHLIVAAPQRQGWMMTKPADIVLKLPGDVLLELLRQIVHGAGEHEILPNQNAQLVADVVEEIVGIVSAAPNPDTVHIGASGILQQPPGALRIHPGQQIVLGNIVRTHGEHIHTVDAVGKGLAPCILLPGHGHGAQTDSPAPAVQNLPFPAQLHFHAVQRLLPVARGPPEPGILNPDLQALITLPIRSDNHPTNLYSLVIQTDQVCVHLQGHRPILMELLHPNVPNPGGMEAHQGNVPPDARVRQPGTPVPAEHAVGLSDQREAHHGIRGAVRGVGGISLLDELCGRRKQDFNPVFPFPQHILHIKFPDSVHIPGFPDQFPVDTDSRQGIQSLRPKQHPLLAQKLRRNLKAAAVQEVMLHQLQRFIFIVPVKGVRDFPCRKKIVVNGTGNRGGNAAIKVIRYIQSPESIQSQGFHAVPPKTFKILIFFPLLTIIPFLRIVNN